MTVAMMGDGTRAELRGLTPETKAELLAWMRNQLAIVIGNADMIADGSSVDDSGRAHAIAITARKFSRELDQLFQTEDKTNE